MKVAACLLAVVALAASAPRPRKDFHEHIEDFVHLIHYEAGEELIHIYDSYTPFDEFNAAFNYLQSTGFKKIVSEVDSLPEYQAVVHYLEANNIDIALLLDELDEALRAIPSTRRISRHASGTSISSFIHDSVSAFPKDKLDALFQKKKEEDEEFRDTIDNFFSDEWSLLFTALLAAPKFQQQATTLEENGISVHYLFKHIKGIFGQY